MIIHSSLAGVEQSVKSLQYKDIYWRRSSSNSSRFADGCDGKYGNKRFLSIFLRSKPFIYNAYLRSSGL